MKESIVHDTNHKKIVEKVPTIHKPRFLTMVKDHLNRWLVAYGLESLRGFNPNQTMGRSSIFVVCL